MLNYSPTATKCVYLVSNLCSLSICLIIVRFYLNFFKRFCECIRQACDVPLCPFCSGAL